MVPVTKKAFGIRSFAPSDLKHSLCGFNAFIVSVKRALNVRLLEKNPCVEQVHFLKGTRRIFFCDSPIRMVIFFGRFLIDLPCLYRCPYEARPAFIEHLFSPDDFSLIILASIPRLSCQLPKLFLGLISSDNSS